MKCALQCIIGKMSTESVTAPMSYEILHKDLANEVCPDIVTYASEAVVESCVLVSALLHSVEDLSVHPSNPPSSLLPLEPAIRRHQEVPHVTTS